MAWTSDDILSNAKLRAFYPTSGGVISDSDLLRLATDELWSMVTAQQMAASQGYLGVEITTPLVASQSKYDISYRAAGGKIRYLCLQDAQNNRYKISFGRPERFITDSNVTTAMPGLMPSAAWFEDGRIVVYPTPAGSQYSLVYGIYLRPSQLVLQASACQVNSTTVAKGATSFSCTAVPAGMNGNTQIDIISWKPQFQARGLDVNVSSLSTGATTITVTESGGLPFALGKFDWITSPGYSVVPQCPLEMHPLLSARTAKRILQARGDAANLKIVAADIAEMESQVYEFLSNRDEGQIDTMAQNNLIGPGKSIWGFNLGGF